MLFGFTLIVIFYYLGKTHDHKKETLKAFLDYSEGLNESLKPPSKYYDDAIKIVVDIFPPAVLRGYLKGNF